MMLVRRYYKSLGDWCKTGSENERHSALTVVIIRLFLMRIWRTFRASQILAPPLTPQAKLLKQTSSSWIYTTPPPSPPRIFKVSNDPSQLQREYDLQNMVNEAFCRVADAFHLRGQEVSLPYVPVCFDFYPELFSSDISDTYASQKQLPPECAAYSMEYIQPLNKYYVKYLVKRHLSVGVQDLALRGANETHNIVKICVGDLKPLSDEWKAHFHDRSAYLDHLYDEQVDVEAIASVMGSVLAIMHWLCGTDAAGIQFMMGCDRRGTLQLWLIDFGDCKPFRKTTDDVTMQLVDAVMNNNCVWPRWINLQPFRGMWASFKRAYIHMSLNVFVDKRGLYARPYLPLLFMQTLEKLRGPGSAF